MKKTVCFAVSLLATAAFAQSKSIEFAKKINYQVEIVETYTDPYQTDYKNLSYDNYLSADGKSSLVSLIYTGEENMYFGSETNFFVKNNWLIPVTVSGISQNISYTEATAFELIGKDKTVVKLDQTATINGFNCQYYALLSDPQNKENYDYRFAVDENNETNNASSIFPESGIKGLIVSVEPKSNDFRLVYKSVEATNLSLNLDTDKLLADIESYQEGFTHQEEEVVEIPAETYQRIYDDPLYNHPYGGFENYDLEGYLSGVNSVMYGLMYKIPEYNYDGNAQLTRDQVLDFYKRESKSLVKNLSAAKIISSDDKKAMNEYFKTQIQKAKDYKPATENAATTADAAAYIADTAMDVSASASDPYDYYEKYESKYKNIEVQDNVSLAYDILGDDNLKQNAPDYCNDLQNKIPDFQSKELKKHVHNLAGQICDLYLYTNGGSVDYFETINEMRKSYLEIEKLRNTLSKKDQKLLLEFIKSLD